MRVMGILIEMNRIYVLFIDQIVRLSRGREGLIPRSMLFEQNSITVAPVLLRV